MAHSNWIIWEGLVRGLFTKMWAGCREITKDSVAAWRIAMGSLRCHGRSSYQNLETENLVGRATSQAPLAERHGQLVLPGQGTRGVDIPSSTVNVSRSQRTRGPISIDNSDLPFGGSRVKAGRGKIPNHKMVF